LDPWHRFSESESEDSADLQKDELPKSPDSLRFVYGLFTVDWFRSSFKCSESSLPLGRPWSSHPGKATHWDASPSYRSYTTNFWVRWDFNHPQMVVLYGIGIGFTIVFFYMAEVAAFFSEISTSQVGSSGPPRSHLSSKNWPPRGLSTMYLQSFLGPLERVERKQRSWCGNLEISLQSTNVDVGISWTFSLERPKSSTHPQTM
jgi:hypothetical protein